jgi:hypothetical protein
MSLLHHSSTPTSSRKNRQSHKSSKKLSVLVEHANTTSVSLDGSENYNLQQQYGRLNKNREPSTETNSLYPVLSPTVWMFDFTRKKITQLCRPFMSGNTNVKMSGDDTFTSGKDKDNNSVSTATSWRNRATQIILGEYSDDDSDIDTEIRDSEGIKIRTRSNRLMSPQLTTGESISSENDARIIAPNVDKLSPISVVEIRLQSVDECVAILCSVDVLKMRSIFYREVRT